jgi:hypothetical protein
MEYAVVRLIAPRSDLSGVGAGWPSLAGLLATLVPHLCSMCDRTVRITVTARRALCVLPVEKAWPCLPLMMNCKKGKASINARDLHSSVKQVHVWPTWQ